MENIQNKDNNQAVTSNNSTNHATNTINTDKEARLREENRELSQRIKDLEAFKYGVESKKERDELYQKYLLTKDESEKIETLITKHKIKDYKTYIEDFHSYLVDHNKQRNENPDHIYNASTKNKETEDI